MSTLSVARDALLEQATIADVLDLARTMALERLARGLPVAWVGPVQGSSRVMHAWLATRQEDGRWALWRDGKVHKRWHERAGEWTPERWHLNPVRTRLSEAPCVLDGDATRAAWGA